MSEATTRGKKETLSRRQQRIAYEEEMRQHDEGTRQDKETRQRIWREWDQKMRDDHDQQLRDDEDAERRRFEISHQLMMKERARAEVASSSDHYRTDTSELAALWRGC